MNHQVLDVRGIQGQAAKIRDIRAMAGRAMLDGPHDYRTEDLEGPLLDLAVSKAVGLKAVIHLVDNALAPFYECCVLNECGRLQYQYIPSRMWSQGGPLASICAGTPPGFATHPIKRTCTTKQLRRPLKTGCASQWSGSIRPPTLPRIRPERNQPWLCWMHCVGHIKRRSSPMA